MTTPVTFPVIGVLHPGQMGAAVAAQARRNGATVLWCPTGRSRASQDRAVAAGLVGCDDLAQLCERADVVLSICPPAAAEAVAAEVAGHGFDGVYVEANAIDPAQSERIAGTLSSARIVLDAAIIGPPPNQAHPSTLYLAGDEPAAAGIAAVFAGTALSTHYLSQPAPAASALKMAYGGYQKASRVLAAVAHALARNYDVTEPLLAEAAQMGASPLADPDYAPSAAARAWRWAPELRNVALTLADNDLPPELAAAAAAVLDRWAGDKDDDTLTTGQALDHLRTR